MGKVIGIGGIFLKFKNPDKMKDWYSSMLGMKTNAYGVLFEFNGDTSEQKGHLQLSPFAETSDYFGNESQQSMINFRVDNLVKLKETLVENNVNIVDSIEEYSYGKFLHIEDPEGNRIELWEPLNGGFEGSNEVMAMK
jgi:predicted enzyme related to lactoylglutathione lyase